MVNLSMQSPASAPKRSHHKKKPPLSLLENNGIVSLTDAAAASDALDDELAARLGPAPVQAEPPRPRSGGTRRGAHKKAAPVVAVESVTAAQLVGPFAGLLGLATFLLGLGLAGFRLDDPLVDFVMMSKEEANGIAVPSANIAARLPWFVQISGPIIGSEDWIALGWALAIPAARIIPPVRARLAERPERPRRERARQNPGVSAGGSASGASNGSANGTYTGPFGLSGAYATD